MPEDGNEPEPESEEEGNDAPAVSEPRAPARVGRPTKLTQEVADAILKAVRGGCFRFQACALAGISRGTLRTWEKAAAAGHEQYKAFIDELEMAQDTCEARLMVMHNQLASAKAVHRQEQGQPAPTIVVDDVPVVRVQLEAIQFQLRNGGTRPWADLKKLELTGKDGERLSGSEVTPAAAAALVRAEFGDQARQALADGEAPEPEQAG